MTLSTNYRKIKSNKTSAVRAFGESFQKGDVPNGKFVKYVRAGDNFGTQCTILNRYDDGSAAFAIMSKEFYLLDVGANVEATYTYALDDVNSGGLGVDLTEADVAAGITNKGDATFDMGVLGVFSLATIVGTPANKDRTRITGPLMSEFHYSYAVNAYVTLLINVRVRLHGHVSFDFRIQNGTKASGPNVVYDFTLKCSNVVMFTKANINHSHHTRIGGVKNGWYVLGGDQATYDAVVETKHNPRYLMDTKRVPNFPAGTPSDGALSGFTQTYDPMGRGNLRASFGGTGYDDQIGILPRWDCLHVMTADPRTYNAVLANAKSGGSYSIHMMDQATKRPYAFSSDPDYWQDNIGGTAGGQAWTHDTAHQPSVGYLAYLLTGDWFYMEEVQYWATYNGSFGSYQTRQHAKCLLYGIARAQAWGLRTLAHACLVTPDGDPLQTEFANSWRANMVWRKNMYLRPRTDPLSEATAQNGPNGIGAMGLYSGAASGDAYSPNDYFWVDAGWMQAFLQSVLGHTSELEIPLQSSADRLVHTAVRDFGYKHTVGLFGGPGGRPYPKASMYPLVYGKTATQDELYSEVIFPANWAGQWALQKEWSLTPFGQEYGTQTDVPATLGQPLLGNSGGAPEGMAGGYWGNFLAPLAFAVQDGAPGAGDAYERVTTAPNYAVNATQFIDVPQFGFVPRVLTDVPEEGTVPDPEPEGPLEVLRTYQVAAGRTIYGGQSAPVIVNPDVPAWVPPTPTDDTALFADVPMTNNAMDVNLNGLYAPSATQPAFTFWGGSSMLKDAAPLGKQGFHAAGHYTNAQEPDYQMTLLCNFSTLAWEVANLPPAPNPNGNGIPPFLYADGTHSNPHTYLGLHDYPAEWGGGPHLMTQFCYGGSGGLALNLMSVFDTSQNVHGYSIEPTNQAGHPSRPDVLSFRADEGASAGNYPVFCQDVNGWWGMTNGDISYSLFIDGPTKEVTQFPPLGGNNQDSAIVSIPSHDLVIGIDGGYSEGGNYNPNAPRRLWILNKTTRQVTVTMTLGPLPTRGQGYNTDPTNVYHMPGKMGLQWVEELGAIYGLDDSTDGQTEAFLYKLSPPASGSWATGQWTWSKIPASKWSGAPSSYSTLRVCQNSVWSKFRWNPKLKAFVYCVANNVKPQVISVKLP